MAKNLQKGSRVPLCGVACRQSKVSFLNLHPKISLPTKSKFDMIILDVMMPGQNGYELTKEIKKQIKVPIISVSYTHLTLPTNREV